MSWLWWTTGGLVLLFLILGVAVRRWLLTVAGVFAILTATLYVLDKMGYLDRLVREDFTNPSRIAQLQGEDLTGSETAASDGWPQFLGPNRDGVVRDGVTLSTDWETSPPKEIWRTNCGGGFASVSVWQGRAYVHSREGDEEVLLCLDADTGEPCWEHRHAVSYSELKVGYDEGPRASPTLHDGQVYTVGATGKFLCLEATPETESARVLWEKDLLGEFRASIPTWGVACSPLIVGNRVIVQPGGRDGSVAAFDPVTGERLWASESDPSGYSSPVHAEIAGVSQVIALTAQRLIGLDVENGSLLWEYPWKTQHDVNAAMPVLIGENHVFISSDYFRGCALVAIEPDGNGLRCEPVFERTRRDLMQAHFTTPIPKDGLLFGFDGNMMSRNQMVCVDVRQPDGPRWASREVEGGQLIRSDDRLIVQTQTGDLVLVRATAEDCEVLGKVTGLLKGSRAWATPTLVGDRLFLRDGEKVLCLELPTE